MSAALGLAVAAKRAASKRLQCVATRGSALGIMTASTGPASNNYTSVVERRRHKTQGADISGVRLLYTNYIILSGQDLDAANAVTLRASIELSSPSVSQPVTFNGSKSVVIDAGASHVLSDPIGYNLLGSTSLVQFFVRTGVNVAAGQTWLRGNLLGLPSESAYESNDTTLAKVDTTGSATGTGGTSQNAAGGMQCTAVLGIPDRPIKSVIIIGDSQERGTGDVTSVEAGYVCRGLVNVASGPIPYINMSRDGESAAVATQDRSYRRLLPAQYCSNAIVGLGDNDGASGQTALQAIANLKILWQRLKGFGIKKVFQILPLPRIASTTDSYATPANMTPYAGFEFGGSYRDPLIALIKAEVGKGLLDDIIDCNVYCEDPANPGKWITNGTANYPTTDGVHPSAAVHALMAQAIAAAAPKFAYF